MAEGKKNVGCKGTLVFIDESGFSEAPAIRRTWTPRGRTPVLRPKCRSWKRMSAVGGLAYRRDGSRHRVFVRFHSGSVRGPQVLTYLKHLLRHNLNPVEALWAWTKGTRLANVREDTLGPVVRRTRNAIRAVRPSQRLLRGFLRKAGLSL
ncbi:MAG: transposase [Planctomycetota bacterium]